MPPSPRATPAAAVWIVVASLLLLGCTIAWVAATALTLAAQAQETIRSANTVEGLRGELLRLDAELTAAVRLAAATGDSRWEQRYHELLPQLDAGLGAVLECAPVRFHHVAAWRSSDNHEELLERELAALALVRERDLAAAQQLVLAPDYDRIKAPYLRAMAEVVQTITTGLMAESGALQRRAIGAVVLAVLAILGVGVLAIAARRMILQRLADASRARLLTELNATLEDARTQAQAASQAKSAFLANVSHELRTPLTAVLGFAEALEDRVTDPDDRESITMILRSGQHLLVLVNDVLDFAKVEAGRMDLMQEMVDLLEILRELEGMLAPQAQERGVHLFFEWAGPVPRTARTDSLRLRQILTNLVGNAIKFTPRDGEVHVLGSIERQRDGSAGLAIEVIDSGIGMDAAQLARLFQPFVQVSRSVDHRYGGTGLGLVISQRLADLLGGQITVRSETGRGSIFRLTLPLGSHDPLELVHPTDRTVLDEVALASPAQLRGRVLLVEDIPANQLLIARILGRAGAEVVLAGDGEQALAEFDAATRQGRPFDLVLMDLQMPVMDGFTATRLLKQRADAPPVIALSAGVMRADVERSRECGCDEFAAKPIRSRDLIAVAARWLGRGSDPDPR